MLHPACYSLVDALQPTLECLRSFPAFPLAAALLSTQLKTQPSPSCDPQNQIKTHSHLVYHYYRDLNVPIVPVHLQNL